jgi:hypothetical protein
VSAVAPVPLPCPGAAAEDRHGDPGPASRGPVGADGTVPEPRPASGSASLPAAGPRSGRPALSVVGTPGAVRVRLARPVEPPAVPLRADGPAHERPPELGSPAAVSRVRPVTRDTGAAPAEGPLPDPTRTCCAVVQAAVEGLRGARPLAQLVRWVTPEVYDGLALRARLVQSAATAPSSGRAGIRRVRVFRIGDGAAEATVVVDDGPRVRAVAVRVEEHRGRWRATALEIG